MESTRASSRILHQHHRTWSERHYSENHDILMFNEMISMIPVFGGSKLFPRAKWILLDYNNNVHSLNSGSNMWKGK